jgi:hypothetical protein
VTTGKQIAAPCACDETVGFDQDARTVHCRACGDWWTFDVIDVTRAGGRIPAEPSRSAVIAEAVLADAVRVERPALPTDSNERKRTPLCTGCLDYFPAALTAVAEFDPTGDTCHPIDELPYALRDRDLVLVAQAALGILAFELQDEPRALPAASTLGEYLDVYAPALAAVAQVSWHGNEKHNPGQPLHHARGKSMDHFDCIARHYVERGGFDGPMRHSACLAWRALAALQEDLESKGAPKARGAK